MRGVNTNRITRLKVGFSVVLKHNPKPQSPLHQKLVSFLLLVFLQHTAHLLAVFVFFSVGGSFSIKCLLVSLEGAGVFEGRPIGAGYAVSP